MEALPGLLAASHVLVATGSRAFRPSGIPFGDPRVLDSDLINGLGFLPRSIAITGSGIIAVEYAKIFQRLGADVTMIIRDKVGQECMTTCVMFSSFVFGLLLPSVRNDSIKSNVSIFYSITLFFICFYEYVHSLFIHLLIRTKVPKKALMKIGLDGDLAAALVTDLVRCGVRIERGTTVESFDLGAAATTGSSGDGGLLVDPSGVLPLKIHLDSGKVSSRI